MTALVISTALETDTSGVEISPKRERDQPKLPNVSDIDECIDTKKQHRRCFASFGYNEFPRSYQ